MKIAVLVAILAVFALLRFRRANLLLWAGAWWIGIYVLLRFGFTAPIPSSVVTLYMGIISIALLAYVSSSEVRRDEVSGPLVRFMTDKRYTVLLGVAIVAIPALAAANVYVQMSVPLQPPLFSRTVHPASPSEITVHDKKVELDAGENPFRRLETSNPAEFRTHVENGRRVFYRNCVFCHGDNLSGNGMFVHGLDPIPTNFTDKGTIAMLRETYLFWRISKGGPGLPEEGGPWASAMPAWEKFLKEDEIWDVVLFLYDYTGQRPRAKEEGAKPMTIPWTPGGHGGGALGRAGRIDARGGAGRRHRGPARVGPEAVSQILLAVPRRKRGRRRIRRPASASAAAEFHDRQVQDPDHGKRRAADASGPGQHHQTGNAVHLDASLAEPCRSGSVGSRVLHHHFLT